MSPLADAIIGIVVCLGLTAFFAVVILPRMPPRKDNGKDEGGAALPSDSGDGGGD